MFLLTFRKFRNEELFEKLREESRLFLASRKTRFVSADYLELLQLYRYQSHSILHAPLNYHPEEVIMAFVKSFLRSICEILWEPHISPSSDHRNIFPFRQPPLELRLLIYSHYINIGGISE